MILNRISSLTENKKQFIFKFTEDLSKIENLKAIALGGSHATGRANKNSDIDLGLYYYGHEPFLIKAIQKIAEKYSTDKKTVVVDFYEWGPWVNGGAWINTEVGKVDLLYRNINQIENTILDAKVGKWQSHYEQQPPFGFTSITYLAESATSVPLFDPNFILRELKELIKPYPKALKQNVINATLWSAEFTLAQVGGFASQKDMYNTLGCFTRCLKNIVDALYAINEIYPIGDKLAVQILSRAENVPDNLDQKINAVLTTDILKLDKNLHLLKELFKEVVELTDGLYRPKFDTKSIFNR
ncbi:nucleotidyltransferase domain-containing protein [Compostibacter hankyongensis]|uniref:Nucleotidyltransferase domain-containing protein n=1 Tax=Compostibacter hankyongensis TaxID=1007089 RepID=A0ABP8G6I7_9BACT